MKIIVSYLHPFQISPDDWKLRSDAAEFDTSHSVQYILDTFHVKDINLLQFSSVLEVKDGSTS